MNSAWLTDGFVRIRHAFPADTADLISDLIWDVFAREFGIRRDDRATWSRVFQKRALDTVASSVLFDDVLTDEFARGIDVVLDGAGWDWPEHWGDFLITFPNATRWELPYKGWHQDWDFTVDCDPIRFCKAFVFLNEVRPTGGGTLVVRGSHRLHGRYDMGRATDANGRIRKGSSLLYEQCPWLRDLVTAGDATHRRARFMDSAEDVDGVALRVVELTGHPGDVVLIHPWLIHTVAPNAADGPRFMRAPVFAATGALSD